MMSDASSVEAQITGLAIQICLERGVLMNNTLFNGYFSFCYTKYMSYYQ